MPHRRYVLSADQPELHIAWMGKWQHITVKQGERTLGVFEHPSELASPTTLVLDDGRAVKVGLVQALGARQLVVTCEGALLVDPSQRLVNQLSRASAALACVGIVGLLVAVVASSENSIRGLEPDVAPFAVVSGIMYLGLAWKVRGRSVGAAIGAIVIVGANMQLALAAEPPLGVLGLGLLLLVLLIRATDAALQLVHTPA